MILDALVLATLSTIGFYMIYTKLPRSVRRFLERHSLLSDLVALILTYILFGGTLTALIAGAMVGIFTSCLLFVAQHPDDFLYLYDFADFVKRSLKSLQVALNEYGKSYREEKMLKEGQNV
jgi:hypothetical protein